LTAEDGDRTAPVVGETGGGIGSVSGTSTRLDRIVSGGEDASGAGDNGVFTAAERAGARLAEGREIDGREAGSGLTGAGEVG
jgi:hypothetical protein